MNDHCFRPTSIVMPVAGLILGILIVIGLAHSGSSAGISNWTSNVSLPEPFAGVNAIRHGDYLYIVGGKSTSAQDFGVSTRVYVAELDGNGNVKSWNTTTPLQEPSFLHATLVTSDHIYVFGGYTGRNSRERVWRAQFLADGALGEWEKLRDMPQAMHFNQAVLVGDRIYIVGGYRDTELFDTVYYSTIKESGISTWKLTRKLPVPLYRHRSVAHNGVIYVLGGRTGEDTAAVYMTRPGEDGQIGAWTETTALPEPRSYHSAVVHDGRIYVLGGRNENLELASVISASILASGELGEWSPEASLPQAIYRFGAATAGRSAADDIYVVGGVHGDELQSAVYRGGAPSPTATPTPTPTPDAPATPQPLADLQVALINSPRGWVAPGQEIRYELRFRNVGSTEVTDVDIIGLVPDHTELVSGSVSTGVADSHTVEGTEAGSAVTWKIGVLQAGGEGVVSYRVTRLELDAPPVPFALEIDKAGPAQVDPGDPIIYTLTITNLVPLTFTNLLVEDVMPANAVYVSGGDAPPNNGVVSWTLPSLASESSAQVEFAVTATTSIVNIDYRVSAEGGTSAVGRSTVVTLVGDKPLSSSPDGVVVANDSGRATWSQAGALMTRRINGVQNPSANDLFLPYVVQR